MYHYMITNTQIALRISTFYYSFTNMSMNFSSVYSSHSFQNGSFCLVMKTSDNVIIRWFLDLKIWRWILLFNQFITTIISILSAISFDNCSFNFYSVHNRRKMLRLYYVWRISESNRWPPACKAGALASWANPPFLQLAVGKLTVGNVPATSSLSALIQITNLQSPAGSLPTAYCQLPTLSSGPAWTRTTDLYIISVAL